MIYRYVLTVLCAGTTPTWRIHTRLRMRRRPCRSAPNSPCTRLVTGLSISENETGTQHAHASHAGGLSFLAWASVPPCMTHACICRKPLLAEDQTGRCGSFAGHRPLPAVLSHLDRRLRFIQNLSLSMPQSEPVSECLSTQAYR